MASEDEPRFGRDRDFADPIGRMRDIRFANLVFDRPSPESAFQVQANISGFRIHGVRLGYDPKPQNLPDRPGITFDMGRTLLSRQGLRR